MFYLCLKIGKRIDGWRCSFMTTYKSPKARRVVATKELTSGTKGAARLTQ